MSCARYLIGRPRLERERWHVVAKDAGAYMCCCDAARGGWFKRGAPLILGKECSTLERVGCPRAARDFD